MRRMRSGGEVRGRLYVVTQAILHAFLLLPTIPPTQGSKHEAHHFHCSTPPGRQRSEVLGTER